jgi:phage repressor protein C with HTH and peptisase S24 domain
MIRRIRQTPKGSWILMPDNHVVRPEEVGDGEVALIGRVIWIGRRI